jgi:CheY-like chemotaxis protein/HPt (histidine-containing phosphotransfer) domain-containing protein
MNAPDALPRLLLLEDDPVSAAFLVEALIALPARVDHAASLAEARSMMGAHDLWLFDANLPDGPGAALLAEWRARGLRTPALAHTAEARRDELDALIDAGFAEVLLKPLSVAQLQGAVRRMLAGDAARASTSASDSALDSASMTATAIAAVRDTPRCGKQPVWDDDRALRALNGQRAHVDAMRGLFLQELPQTVAKIADAVAGRRDDVVRSEWHRLIAACGFVGAARLQAAIDAWRDAPTSAAAREQFEGAARDTLSTRPPSASGAPPDAP